MNTNQIAWFCAAYEQGSFAKAAEGAFVSRQAFGKAMRSMEGELGVRLFERRAAGAHPTEAAVTLYPEMKACLEAYEKTLDAARAISGEKRSVRIVFSDAVPASLPDGFFVSLEEALPQASFVLEKHFAPRCYDLLESGEADFAICPGTDLRGDMVEQLPLAEFPLYVILNREISRCGRLLFGLKTLPV